MTKYDIIVIIILALCIISAVFFTVKNRKKGKGCNGCCENCGDCGTSCKR